MIVVTSSVLFARLVDVAASDPDGVLGLTDVIDSHRRHRESARGQVVGLLAVRASAVGAAVRTGALGEVEVVLIADTGAEQVAGSLAALAAVGVAVRRVEVPVAKRGEDPVPGLRRLVAVAAELPVPPGSAFALAVHAEVPLSGGLMDALDLLAAAGAEPQLSPGSLSWGVTFRIGGLAAELFPPPAALAAIVCACRDRGLRFTVNAGLHRAVRHNDPETGFTHHGVLNLLAACLTAATGAPVATVAERLAATDPLPLVEVVRARRDMPRPLFAALTSGRVDDILADLAGMGLV